MSSEYHFNKQLSTDELYSQVLQVANEILDEFYPSISNLSNFCSLLKEAFDKISWVGFYIKKGDSLWLGPFQGKSACVKIDIGRGVCGKAAQEGKTIIVPDVNKFPGHIACDNASQSEIVVPIFIENNLWGVLDLDSYELSAFDETDKRYLEELVKLLAKKGNLKDGIFN